MKKDRSSLVLCNGVKARYDENAGAFLCVVNWADAKVLVRLCCDQDSDLQIARVKDTFVEQWKERRERSLWKNEYERLFTNFLQRAGKYKELPYEFANVVFGGYYVMKEITYTAGSEDEETSINVEYIEEEPLEGFPERLNIEGNEVDGFDRFYRNGVLLFDDQDDRSVAALDDDLDDDYYDLDDYESEDPYDIADTDRAQIRSIPMTLNNGMTLEYRAKDHIWTGRIKLFGFVTDGIFECDEDAISAQCASDLYEEIWDDERLRKVVLKTVAAYVEDIYDEAGIKEEDVVNEHIPCLARIGNDGKITMLFDPAGPDLKIIKVEGTAEKGFVAAEAGSVSDITGYIPDVEEDNDNEDG